MLILPDINGYKDTFLSTTLPIFPGGESYTYTCTNLPAGLSFNATTRVISGTPTDVGASVLVYTGNDITTSCTINIYLSPLSNNTPRIDTVTVFSEPYAVTTNLGFETFATGTNTATSIGNKTLPRVVGTTLSTTWITTDIFTNILRIIQNGTSIDISIPVGSALSPIYIAHYITNTIKGYGLWCDFTNGKFIIASQVSSDILSIGVPSNNGATILGLASATVTSGGVLTNSYNGSVTFNNTYLGVSQATYWVKVSGNPIFSVTPGSSNYYNGTITVDGNFSSVNSISYQITLNTLQGNMAEKGKLYCPSFSVSSTYGDSLPVTCEILYYNYWYEIGNCGVRIKFSEYPFADGDTFQIDCLPPQTADGTTTTATEDTAKFIVLSTDGTGISTPTSLTAGVLSLSKGMSISFSPGTFAKGDTFMINGFGPTFSEVGFIDLGISGRGEKGLYGFTRLIAKEGIHRLCWCKIGLKTPGDMITYNYGDSMVDIGVLGSMATKNSCELPSNFSIETLPASLASHTTFLPVDSFVDVQGGSPLFATDFWYFSLTAGAAEATQEFYPSFSLYYNYK